MNDPIQTVAAQVVDQIECLGEQPSPEYGVHTFWKGRVALYGTLKVLGVGTGDYVIVPGYTGFTVPSAICFTGARPLYVDIDPQTYNLSLETIKAACRVHGEAGVKAIVIQHTYGIPADVEPIVAWARERGIATIEDCAHIWGSRYRDARGIWREVGTMGDAAFFSSQWNKPVSTGLGGWVGVRDPELDAGLRRFHDRECVSPSWSEVLLLAGQVAARKIFSSYRMYWLAFSTYQYLYMRGFLVIGSSTPGEFMCVRPPAYAKRMSSFQQWLLKRQLSKTWIQAHRRRLRQVYDRALAAAGLTPLVAPENVDPVLLRYPVRVRDKARVLAEARRRWIELGDWYKNPVQAERDSDVELFGYRWGMCPEGERATREVVNLPMHSQVTEETARQSVDFLTEVA
jgi:perosamine synthetase